MPQIIEEIRSAIHSRHPLLYLLTPEEDRVRKALLSLATEMGDNARVSSWNCVTGLESTPDPVTRDPVSALTQILANPHPGFYVMNDLSEFIDKPDVIRALRNAYHQLTNNARTCIVIVSPVLTIPELLNKEICLVEISLPEPALLLQHALDIGRQYPHLQLPPTLHSAIALALRGLTINEAGHVIHRVFKAGSMAENDILDQIFNEKKMLLRKAGFLEYVPNRIDVAQIGGLDVLKDWATKRRHLFTQEAVDAGLPIPKGILIMGISGCGKSMSAKAIAALWRVPLFRLDMNLVFSGLYGSPEAAFHRALRAIESVSPAVLWIDEIENALGMTVQSATTEQSLTFSSFLTWMQERPPLTFVAATANRIESLPAEVIRKGRFDEVFFCDLPDEEERREILRIHLLRNNAPLSVADIDRLLHSTDGWTGAEIEQAVVAARIDAAHEQRAISLEDIRRHTTRMVPLSTTMAEQIRAIRSWSFNRATRASRQKQRSMVPPR